MNDNVSVATVHGRYFWELVFSYDNSGNAGELHDTTTITKKRIVVAKELLATKFNVTSGFSFKNESNFSLDFNGVRAGDNAEFTFHKDLAQELVKTSEENRTIDEEVEVKREYVVAGGSSLSLYRLCYESDGASLATDIVATEPRDDIFVEIDFSCRERILGLEDILALFARTTPRRSNAEEWKRIRDSIVEYGDRTQHEAFRHFVETLSGIVPREDNRAEWAAIRQTCGEIINSWDATAKQLLFRKLNMRFNDTKPQRDNREEWAAIRDLSQTLLNAISQVF